MVLAKLVAEFFILIAFAYCVAAVAFVVATGLILSFLCRLLRRARG